MIVQPLDLIRMIPRSGLSVVGGGEIPVVYLLRDDFTADANAPLTSPRTCDPGPGSLTLVQTDGSFRTASGEMIITEQSSPSVGDLGLYGVDGVTRVAGACLKFSLTIPTGTTENFAVYWQGAKQIVATTILHGIYFITSLALHRITSVNAGRTASVRDTSVDGYIILRTSGAFTIYNGKLIWVDKASTTTPVYPCLMSYAGAVKFGDVRVANASAPWDSDYGIATSRVASPTNPAAATSTADSIIEFTWTSATGETLDIAFRRTDADNCIIVRCKQASSTIEIIAKVAGVETQQHITSQAFTNGSVYRVVVTADNNVITTYVNNTILATFNNVAFNRFETGVVVSGFTTGSELICWPRNITQFPF